MLLLLRTCEDATLIPRELEGCDLAGAQDAGAAIAFSCIYVCMYSFHRVRESLNYQFTQSLESVPWNVRLASWPDSPPVPPLPEAEYMSPGFKRPDLYLLSTTLELPETTNSPSYLSQSHGTCLVRLPNWYESTGGEWSFLRIIDLGSRSPSELQV